MAVGYLRAQPRATACLLVLGTLAVPALGTLELTDHNWEAETAGKTMLVDFMAPECDRCVKLKPIWDQLAGDYKGSVYSGVYSVDCQAWPLLCNQHKVEGMPTVKYGNASAGKKGLKVYAGSAALKDLRAFAKKLLGLPCTIAEPKHCTDRDRELISQFEEMPVAELRKDLSSAQGSFKERERQLRNRRKAFGEEQDTFEMELKEFKAEKKIFKKEEKKFEKKMEGIARATERLEGNDKSMRHSASKVTQMQQKLQEEKTRKMAAKAEDLESRRQSLVSEREAMEQVRWALDAEARESGLKLMQLIAESRGHAPEEL